MIDLPLVSIITPAYNRASFLRETIDSVLSQDYPRVEYIVLDDGSTDETREVLSEYTGRILWQSHPNMGETPTVNKGFGMAQGEILSVVNSDDPLLPYAITATVETLLVHNDVLVAYPDWNYIGPSSEFLANVTVCEYDYLYMLKRHRCIVGPGAFTRRRGLDVAGLRDAEFRYVADFEHWLRLGLCGRFIRIPQTLATHRVHPGQATTSQMGSAMALEHVRMIEKFYSRPDLPVEVEQVRAEALAWAELHASQICGKDVSAAKKHALKFLMRVGSNIRPQQHKQELNSAVSILLPPVVLKIVSELWRIMRPFLSFGLGCMKRIRAYSVNKRLEATRGTRTFIKKCLLKLHRLFPWIIKDFFEVVSIVLKRIGPNSTAYDVLYRNGFHLLRRDDHLPIPEEGDLNEEFLKRPSDLVGLQMNDELALDLLNNVFPPYINEFRELFPNYRSSTDSDAFFMINGGFMAVDAHTYYVFIRHFKPKRVVEIGAGLSTQVAAAAGNRNDRETGYGPSITAIVPFPAPFLSAGFPGLTSLIQERVQRVDLRLFGSLENGDILFIDSTHVLREGGDVQYEYCEILPRLAPGVLVHIHDIGLPKPYPSVYYQNQWYWNEQYLLQAFMAFNSRFQIIWPGAYMFWKYPDQICSLIPEFHIMRESFPLAEPSSFWIRAKTND